MPRLYNANGFPVDEVPPLLRRKKGPGILDPDAPVWAPPGSATAGILKASTPQIVPTASDTGSTGVTHPQPGITVERVSGTGFEMAPYRAQAGARGEALTDRYLDSQNGLISEAERTGGLRQQVISSGGGGRRGGGEQRTITTGSAPSRQDFQFSKTGTNANPSVTFQSPAEKMAEMQARQDRIGSLQRGAVQTANRAQSTAAGANRVATIRGTEARYGGGSRGVVNYLPSNTPQMIADERGQLTRTASGNFVPNIPRRPAGVSPAIAHNDIMGRSAPSVARTSIGPATLNPTATNAATAIPRGGLPAKPLAASVSREIGGAPAPVQRPRVQTAVNPQRSPFDFARGASDEVYQRRVAGLRSIGSAGKRIANIFNPTVPKGRPLINRW